MADGPEVWLIRHTETEWTRAKKHTGRTDLGLTDTGREQARALRARLAGKEFSLVLSSPLGRARETAELAGLGEHLQLADDLLEWDYGDHEGITTAEIRQNHPDWQLWRDGAPNGESPEDVRERCDRVIATVLRAGGDVAIFAHGHLLRALGARWVEQPVAFGARLYLGTGSLSILGFEREARVLRLWNEVQI